MLLKNLLAHTRVLNLVKIEVSISIQYVGSIPTLFRWKRALRFFPLSIFICKIWGCHWVCTISESEQGNPISLFILRYDAFWMFYNTYLLVTYYVDTHYSLNMPFTTLSTIVRILDHWSAAWMWWIRRFDYQLSYKQLNLIHHNFWLDIRQA